MSILRSLLLGLIVGGSAVFTFANADDTDIFLGKNGGSNFGLAPSNIFFLLDTSSSMSWAPASDPSSTQIKMDILKQSMEDILALKGPTRTLRNVNIGFGTFYRPGAVIDYPILPIDGTGINGGVVRTEITNMIKGLGWENTWGTPLSSAYYEAMSYMMGKNVLFGLTARDWANLVDDGLRGELLSNPSTYNTETPLVYNFDSLTDDACATNSIILLSDGQATSGEGYPEMVAADPTTFNTFSVDSNDAGPCDNSWGEFERCGRELADYAFQRTDSADPNAPPVFTHTIGFDIDAGSIAERYLEDVANAGRGQYHKASNKDQLIQTFLDILAKASETTSAFAPPTVPVNTSNRLFSESEVFLNLFGVENKPIWQGNIKKFGICQPDDTGCDTGDYIGSDGQVAVDSDGGLLRTVGDAWDSGGNPSAASVLSGGVASKVTDWRTRKIFTWTQPSYPTTVDTSTTQATRGWDLYQVHDENEIIADASGEPDLSDIVDSAGSSVRLRKRLFQAHGLCDAGGTIDTDCMNSLVKFLLGGKTRDTQPDGFITDNRWPISDILHSDIVTIPYSTTETEEAINKIAFATNDGGLHLHDGKTGNEHFVFYPQEVLDQLASLEAVDDGTAHIYGLDGSPTIRIRDVNKNHKIEPGDGDFIHLYIGMRRGGYSYYAINLTPDATLTNHTDAIGTPELLFTIRGTTITSDPYVRLGQTWSKPQTAQIFVKASGQPEKKTVLIFGGGYDPNTEDGDGQFVSATAETSSLGNAIYIVDAEDGKVLWWASKHYNLSSGTNGIEVDGMRSSIPSDIKLVDTNNDRVIDRLYAADLAGQVWRVDLHADLADNTVGRLASLSQAGDPSDSLDNTNERKFFYEPDFVRVRDSRFGGSGINSENYDVVALVSGNRANPTDSTVDNRAYIIRDYLNDETMLPLGSASPTNYPKCNPGTATGCSSSDSIDNDGLFDVSDKLISPDADPSTNEFAEMLSSKNGYYFTFSSQGELGFSKTQVLAGKIYFTTYVPSVNPVVRAETVDSIEQCRVDPGNSNLYVIDLLSGSPAVPRSETPTTMDRSFNIGKHPVSPAVPVVSMTETGQSILEAKFQAGPALPPDPAKSDLTFYPTFWYQE